MNNGPSTTAARPPADGSLQNAQCLLPMLWISLMLFAPQLVGSAFNIWYNLLHIEPLLTAGQLARFGRAIFWVNLILYPVAIAFGLCILWSLQPTLRRLCAGEPVPEQELIPARARVINIPWWGLGIAATCWLLCIPIFLTVLTTSTEPLDPRVYLHLPASLLISGSIAVSIGFFLLELAVLKWLYPPFFGTETPHGIPGSVPLSLRGRGVMWVLSACVCPIGCLLLLMLEPESLRGRGEWFALSVGAVAACFGIVSAWASSNLLLEPVRDLRRVAHAVRNGNLNVRVAVQRADEFGPLIETVNEMLADLREKERLSELFGRHVGRAAAEQLLQQAPGTPAGVERELTVLFADLRGFTARAARTAAPQTVALLNEFLTEMVDVVESVHGGIVNKFLGDGLMALFGAIDAESRHADAALLAAVEMVRRLEEFNARTPDLATDPWEMGIGISTGPAIVGSIGSARRGEFTAIGSTVNVASRLEAQTKQIPQPILLSHETHHRLSDDIRQRFQHALIALPPTIIRGFDTPLALFAVDTAV